MGVSSEHKSKLSLLVTDSGLGGFSVFSDIAGQLEASSPWQNVDLTYFNAWPSPHKGYNHFPTPEKRAQIFNNAMEAMMAFSPEKILIACNTLSVIYPKTEFSKTTDIPVEGIVDHGVTMMTERLNSDQDSRAVIFGTPTTIKARSHETGLIDSGIDRNRIINIACTNLAGFIEREPFSNTVGELIDTFVKEASDRLADFSGPVYAALCCTHFGYRQSLFQEAFEKYYPGKVTLLNPNVRMAQEALSQAGSKENQEKTQLNLKVVSQAVWSDEQIEGCLKLLANCSGSVKTALRNYEQNTHLFSVD